MSSFYGQERWEQFEQFFYNFTLRNKEFASNNVFNENPSKANEATIPANDTKYIQPNEDHATFQINAANHWLKVNPIDFVDDNYSTFTGFSMFYNKSATIQLSMIKMILQQPTELVCRIVEQALLISIDLPCMFTSLNLEQLPMLAFQSTIPLLELLMLSLLMSNISRPSDSHYMMLAMVPQSLRLQMALLLVKFISKLFNGG